MDPANLYLITRNVCTLVHHTLTLSHFAAREYAPRTQTHIQTRACISLHIHVETHTYAHTYTHTHTQCTRRLGARSGCESWTLQSFFVRWTLRQLPVEAQSEREGREWRGGGGEVHYVPIAIRVCTRASPSARNLFVGEVHIHAQAHTHTHTHGVKDRLVDVSKFGIHGRFKRLSYEPHCLKHLPQLPVRSLCLFMCVVCLRARARVRGYVCMCMNVCMRAHMSAREIYPLRLTRATLVLVCTYGSIKR
jgi:hypothetical protein